MTGAVAVERWDVFARAPGGGNPCYLIRDGRNHGADDARDHGAEAAQLAARRYAAEAALVTGVDGTGVTLRYFSPGGEMAMCGHATIAAVTALIAAGELFGNQAVVRALAGEFEVGWDGAAPPLVSIDHPGPRFGPPVPATDEVARSLGLPPDGLGPGAELRVVSIGRAKLLVPLPDAEAVHAARPDPERLGELCRSVGATGAYVYAPHPDGRADHLVARQFPVDAGVAEDPATGVAAGALAAYLAYQAGEAGWTAVEVDQGDAMGLPSRLQARALLAGGTVSRAQVAGHAELIGRELVRV